MELERYKSRRLIHGAAVVAKQDYAGIVNDNTKDWFVRAAVSQEYADKWRAEVTPMTGKRLMDAQRVTAGYIQLWFDTYGNRLFEKGQISE